MRDPSAAAQLETVSCCCRGEGGRLEDTFQPASQSLNSCRYQGDVFFVAESFVVGYNLTSKHRCVSGRQPGRHAEVLLDEVAGDRQRQQGDEEDGRDVADDAQGGDAQQGGAAEALQGGGDVLVDGVGVCGEPVEDAAQRGGLEEPGGGEAAQWFSGQKPDYCSL